MENFPGYKGNTWKIFHLSTLLAWQGITHQFKAKFGGKIMAKDSTTRENIIAPPKASIKERLEEQLMWVVLVIIVISFGAGIGAYRGLLEITNQETVIKGSYLLKSELSGNVLKNEAVREIDHMIDSGQSLGNEEAKMRIWLMQVLAFIHGMELEKDSEWQGQKMSAIESDIRYALTDPSIEVQSQKTLGILKGFRAALQTRISTP
jgi:hypothetical protein